ncbi:hypothetical protein GGS23DRAFT_437725 [Durotheca rogersii]|uniref:uncharacterized protein n=1 Tax=Durotheca rogersii TaxID=419775 RepID=UPI002220B1E7|nr:uncharacterized protein GGS23DRAFT_437725 [Durotheca rogersii]KAI5856142.1 hypothetical protein GGS23DRAFT_437725 [Durotheca rogersii]
MAYERYIARMTLLCADGDDTFPERHTSDLSLEAKARTDTRDDDSTQETSPEPFRRRPRRRSESIDGYEMRDRYWEAMGVINRDLKDAAKAPAVWDYVYDPVCLPPSRGPRTPVIRRLGNLPIRRAWRRRNNRESPDTSSARAVEAIMVYERGVMLSQQSQCTNCQQGRGISPGCVVAEQGPEAEAAEADTSTRGPAPTCSNCLYDGRDSQCDARAPSSGLSPPPRERTRTPIKRTFSPTPNHLEVLDLVEKVLKLHRVEKADEAVLRARQIETAALEIAQAAHEWGESTKEKRRKCRDPKEVAN